MFHVKIDFQAVHGSFGPDKLVWVAIFQDISHSFVLHLGKYYFPTLFSKQVYAMLLRPDPQLAVK
jgi:hypothetical protein